MKRLLFAAAVAVTAPVCAQYTPPPGPVRPAKWLGCPGGRDALAAKMEEMTPDEAIDALDFTCHHFSAATVKLDECTEDKWGLIEAQAPMLTELATCRQNLSACELQMESSCRASIDSEYEMRVACETKLATCEDSGRASRDALRACVEESDKMKKNWPPRIWKAEGALRWYERELRTARAIIAACRRSRRC